MIAATRPMATLDFLLVALSAAAGLQASWPDAGPRQVFQYRHSSGHVQQYSLATHDPRLELLAETLTRPPQRRPTAAIAKMKWLAETADFYVGRTRPKKDAPGIVLPVSYRPTGSAEATQSEADFLSAEQGYWIKVRDESRHRLAQAETRLAQQRSVAAAPTLMLGDVVPRVRSPSVLLTTMLLGFCIAGLFAFWAYKCPAMVLHGDPSDSELQSARSERRQPREVRVVIPSRWVRVHQPAAVTVRRFAQAAVVAAGLAAAISWPG